MRVFKIRKKRECLAAMFVTPSCTTLSAAEAIRSFLTTEFGVDFSITIEEGRLSSFEVFKNKDFFTEIEKFPNKGLKISLYKYTYEIEENTITK